MKTTSGKALRLLIALVTASALLATARTPASARPARAGLPTLRWSGLTGDATWVQSLDPSNSTDAISTSVVQLVYAALVKLTPSGRPIPDLATWRISRNHRVYWFTLRKNARFNNGDPVTAQDVIFSLTRSLAKTSQSPVALLYLGHILGAKRLNEGKTNRLQGVKALSPREVQITLDKPIPYFLKTITYSADIIDQRVMAGKQPGVYATDTCSANVGAGPFMFACRNGSINKSSFYPLGATPTMTLIPNPYYYGPKPHIRIVMRVIPDTQTNYRLFQANEVDTTALPSADVAANRGKPGFIQFLSDDIEYLAPNFDAAPFNNIHCRLALAYAIDQNAINNEVLHHAQLPLYSAVPRGVPGYYADPSAPHYDPTRARSELTQCPDGLHHVQLVYFHGSTDLDNEFAAMQNMFSQVGIGVTLKALTFNDWLIIVDQPLYKTHTTLTYDNWFGAFPDPEQWLNILFRGGSVQNVSDFNNPTYNRLVDQADVTFNRTKRAQLYIQAQKVLLEQVGVIPFGQPVTHVMVKPWVHGLVGTPFLGSQGIWARDDNWANVSISPH